MPRDVIVVGGGAIGLAIAYYLAGDGVPVTLLERDQVGAHASSVAAGMLAAQKECKTDDAYFRLCLASRDAYPDFATALRLETGIDIEVERTGILQVAFDALGLESLAAAAAWQRAAGQPAQMLTPAEVAERAPGLGPVAGALLAPADGSVNNQRLVAALAQACRLRGVDLRENTPVLGFLRAGDRVVGVQTAQGDVHAEQVVLAAGAWAGVLARGLGLDLPVFPVRGQLWWATHDPRDFQDVVFAPGAYLVPKRDGRLVVGATQEPTAGFDTTVHLEGYLQVGTPAARAFPAVAQATIQRTLVGLRPGSPDGWPILGPWPGVEGLFIAGGHFRNGILLTPITGQAVAAALQDQPTPVDLAPFSPARFVPTAAAAQR